MTTSVLQVLVAEFLLADADAWSQASASMQQEAVAMLAAIAEDLSSIPGVFAVIPASAESCRRLEDRLSCRQDRLRLAPITSGGLESWLNRQKPDADQFAATLVIAPECGGILTRVLRQLQTGVWGTVRSLNLNWHIAARFSDKTVTAQWLQEQGFQTPHTVSVSEDLAMQLRNMHDSGSQPVVLKPRDGAGSDRVFRLRIDPSELHRVTAAATRTSCEADAPWILQPEVPGIHCSIGLIGNGHDDPLVLPPARQLMADHPAQFHYAGGMVRFPDDDLCGLTEVARTFAHSAGRFAGYLGLDAVVSLRADGTSDVTVIEVNPRLCTSYIGYRQLCRSNPASAMLGDVHFDPEWRNDVVRFSSDGTLRT